jgi:alpha-1,2-mannosyltransferase
MASAANYDGRSPRSGGDGLLSPLLLFSVLLVPRLLAARYSVIGDCDEGSRCAVMADVRAVFNYWEPTHYLVHGSGFQTWEYSPVYAIRSWAYVALHAAVIQVLQVLHFTKVAVPYISVPNLQGTAVLRPSYRSWHRIGCL